METLSHGIPDFGLVVERRQILQVSRSQSPALMLVCAPAGYGKTVLATQLARDASVDLAFWVPLYDSDIRSNEWLSHLAIAIHPEREEARAERSLDLATASAADTMLRISEGLQAHRDKAICVVLDGCNRLESLQALEEAALLLRNNSSPRSRLIVTCRFVLDCGYVPDPASVWVVDERDLRFGRAEVHELLRLMGRGDEAEEAVPQILERFAGHPALTMLMLRHTAFDDGEDPPQDLVWHTRRLVSHLPDETLGMLYPAAMMRAGTAGELSSSLEGGDYQMDWALAQGAGPLLTLLRHSDQTVSGFRMHAILCEALVRLVPQRLGDDTATQLRQKTLATLAVAGDYVRLHGALMTACVEGEIGQWCESHGGQMLRSVGPAAFERCLNRIAPAAISSRPSLLLLRAAALREQERNDEALAHAVLAKRLAENTDDWNIQVAASLLIARLSLDSGRHQNARDVLRGLEGDSWARLDVTSRCQCESYMAAVEAQAGNLQSARERSARALELLDDMDAGSYEAAFAVNCVASVEGLGLGRWDRAAAVMNRVSLSSIRSPLQAVQRRANMAAANLELGSVRDALRALEEVIGECRAAGLAHLEGYAMGTKSSAQYALFECVPALGAYVESQRILFEKEDDYAIASEQVNHSVALRANGRGEESLAVAEAAAARVKDRATSMLLTYTAETEIAASLLALGDSWGARRIANRIRGVLHGSGACAHILRVDLVLAEIDRLDGQSDKAIARLREHAEYILTGSANWLVAMYVRAFPGLLGLFSSAVGTENLPLRMLRMVSVDVVDAAVALGSFEDEADVAVTRRRIVGKVDLEQTSPSASADLPPCQVRLFGGLNVTTGEGMVDEESWRKRKARLLFAMLVVRQGQDLSRDVIMEHLWPDMDEEHAKRNFYVTWSTMKRALSCGGKTQLSSHLVQCSGGVCRVTKSVHSDLDAFDDAIARVRSGEITRDREGLLAAARELLDVYRGELLPGDLYEEWFGGIRERTKHDFCDAMMSASRVAEAQEEFEQALVFLRRACAADAWREDIYQATMRCQMMAGQRSRAIETYLSCRSRLTEDLGIDPSVETTRLYQAVLAMDGDAGSGDVAP